MMFQQMVQEIFIADNWRITDRGSLVSAFFSWFVYFHRDFQLKAKSGGKGVAQSEGDDVI